MARNEQLIRQHKLLQLLEATRFGRTLGELRDDLVSDLGLGSLHERSVRRDLEALQAAGFPVVTVDTQRGKVWKLGPAFRGTHKITASVTELIALSVGRDLMMPLAGTPFWIGIETFWNKIQQSLPDGVWEHYQKYRDVLHVLGTPAKSYRRHQGILKTLHRAIVEHRVVSAEYQSLGTAKPTTRLIHPYAVVLYQSSLYIVVDLDPSSSDKPNLRHLKLDRFRKADPIDRYFKPRADVDVKQHLSASIGIFAGESPQRFKIRVSSFAAAWVLEDPWHPDQQVKMLPDGGLILRLRAAHEMEIIPKVLALGTEAELLAPRNSRIRLRRMIRNMARLYRDTEKK